MTGSSDSNLEITPQVLLKAYACGIFPMAESAQDTSLFWVEPEERGILPIQDFHLPRSLRKTLRRGIFEIRIDHDFEGVIRACAESRPERESTWINDRIVGLYCGLHEMGHCHSVECYSDGKLVGGLYGVRLGAAFFGESMFTRQTDASKVALAHLVARLHVGGFKLLDTQFITGHLLRFGAVAVPRREYTRMLDEAVSQNADFFAYEGLGGGASDELVLQSLSQIS